MYAWVYPPAGEVHNDRTQWCQSGTARHHQYVAAIAVDLQAAMRAGQSPSVAGLGLGDDGVADEAARDRPYMELDGPAVLRRDGGCQVSPPPRALRHSDVDVLACVVIHRAVQL